METNRKGFTLVEMLVACALLMMWVDAAYGFIENLWQRSQELAVRASAVSEIQTLNATLSTIVRNSYGISYEDTSPGSDDGVLTLYTDKQERNKASIYVSKDEDKDVSRVYVRYNSDPPQPLHSTALFVTKFLVLTSPNPKGNAAALEDQPWVSAEIAGRSRSLLERPTDDSFFRNYEKAKTQLYGRWVLRNYVPSSLKQ